MAFIIVGVDGSEGSQKALRAAVQQALHADATVRAISVVSLPAVSGYEFGPIDLQAMTDAASDTLAAAIDQVNADQPNESKVSISGEVKVGHAGTELMRAAQADSGAAMIVAGSRGFGGVKSMLLGSTTTFLAHHLTCPLLIIPSDEAER